MSEDPKARPANRTDGARSAARPVSGTQPTPSTDMQAEDTGTPESGNTGTGPAAEKAMKQTSKSDGQGGRQR